ncbi:MAG: PorT family protein [Bacteroidales bacterium]|nr:PorT family protein [Bacteroidales bacterium]
MNRKIAILAITLLFPLAAFAQRGGDYDYQEPDKEIESKVSVRSNVTGPAFHYGVKAGFNLTTFSSDADDLQARLGQMGFICRWQWKNFAIQPEIYYMTMGVRSLEHEIKFHPNLVWRPTGMGIVGHEDLTNDEDFRLGFTTKNIQFPVIFKYYLPFRKEGFNIQAGPTFNVDCDYKASTPSPLGYLYNPEFGEYYWKSKDTWTGVQSLRRIGRNRNRVSAIAQFGIGYDSKSGIGVDVRCGMGLTPVFKDYYNTNAKNRFWALSFTYVL